METEDVTNAEAGSAAIAAVAPKKKGGRVWLPLLVLAVLLIALAAGAAAYYAITLSGTSTAQVAGTGTHRIALTGTPSAPVQGAVLEYGFDVEAANPETNFTYVLGIGLSEGSAMTADDVKYRLWRKEGDVETEISVSSDGLYKDAARMSFDAGSTQKHSYVLRAISNEAGKLGFDVTVTATQAIA